jgi:hypothetical protein
MQQKEYKSMDDIVAAAIKAVYGGTQNAALNLVYHPPAAIELSRVEFVESVGALASGRVELKTRRVTRETKRVETYNFTMLSRDNFKSVFGRKPSLNWEQLGYKDSLEVPKNPDDLAGIVGKTADFLEANPGMEVAPKGITAAQATAVYNGLTNAINAVNSQVKAIDDLTADRDFKLGVLRGNIRGLIKELGELLDPMDSRWIEFGFNKPGLKETPPAPTGVSVTLMAPDGALVKWGRTARAEYYRVWKRVVGVDAEFVAVGSPGDLDLALEGLPKNVQIEIAVSAVNNGGESPKSAGVIIQLT